jgi:hypothetical protein
VSEDNAMELDRGFGEEGSSTSKIPRTPLRKVAKINKISTTSYQHLSVLMKFPKISIFPPNFKNSNISEIHKISSNFYFLNS